MAIRFSRPAILLLVALAVLGAVAFMRTGPQMPTEAEKASAAERKDRDQR